MLRTSLTCALLNLPLCAFSAEPVTVSPEMQARAEKAAASVVISPEIQARIEAISKTVTSEQWQDKQNSMLTSLQKGLGLETPPASKLPPKAQDKVVLFISASIPEPTLRRYAADVAKVNGVMLLRGMVGGLHTVQPTLDFLRGMLKKDPLCEGLDCPLYGTAVLIDPLPFRELKVTEVPALTVIHHFQMDSYCERDSKAIAKSPVIYGDASVAGLLQEFQRLAPHEDVTPWIHQLSGATP